MLWAFRITFETLKWESRKSENKIVKWKRPGKELNENSTRKLWNGFQFNKSIFDSLTLSPIFLWLFAHAATSPIYSRLYCKCIVKIELYSIENIESKIQQKMKEFSSLQSIYLSSLPSWFVFHCGLTDLPWL